MCISEFSCQFHILNSQLGSKCQFRVSQSLLLNSNRHTEKALVGPKLPVAIFDNLSFRKGDIHVSVMKCILSEEADLGDYIKTILVNKLISIIN